MKDAENQMSLKVRKLKCDECPFKPTSIKGWLGEHTVDDIKKAMSNEQLFSCHSHRVKDETTTAILTESGKIPICRGFIESSLKSAKIFGKNPFTGVALKELQNEVRKEEAMSIFDFMEHHNLNNNNM